MPTSRPPVRRPGPREAATPRKPRRRLGYRINELSELLGGISRPTIYNRIADGTLTAVKIGGIVIITAESVERMLAGEARPHRPPHEPCRADSGKFIAAAPGRRASGASPIVPNKRPPRSDSRAKRAAS